jgi:hypothetical protein
LTNSQVPCLAGEHVPYTEVSRRSFWDSPSRGL